MTLAQQHRDEVKAAASGGDKDLGGRQARGAVAVSVTTGGRAGGV